MHTDRLYESTVPSPLGPRQSTTFSPNTDPLDQILQSVRQKIESWGRDAKWKIDLLLTEPSQQPIDASSSSSINNRPDFTDHSLAVSAQTRYPWDYVAPYYDKRDRKTDDEQEKKLCRMIEQNQYLEGIVRAQADQLRQLPILSLDANHRVETMKQVYVISENEQRLRYMTETRMLHKDIQTLTHRLEKMAQKLYTMEKDDHAQDRHRLRQKLYLLQLRLEARDAELDYLRLKQLPNRRSALDDLGMVADQMLSDYEQSTRRQKRKDDDDIPTYYQRPLNHFKNEKRSKRAITNEPPKDHVPWIKDDWIDPKTHNAARPDSHQQTYAKYHPPLASHSPTIASLLNSDHPPYQDDKPS